MRSEFVLVLTLATSACAIEQAGGGDDTGDGGGGGGGGGGGWTAMPLVDDLSNPNRAVFHKDNDRVVGIYYESADKGLIVSQGAAETFGRGGAVFAASGTEVKKVLFSGDGTGVSLLGSIDFTGIERTASGYIAMAHASDVIQSRDGGATFTIEKNGPGFGIEPVLGYKVTSSGTTLVRKSGVVTTASTPPGTSTSYTDLWAPNASPPIPNPVPAAMCKGGPRGAGVPTTPASVYVSSDRNFIAYTSNPGTNEPQVCISTDGGRSFTPRKLSVAAAFDAFVPTGVTFTSASTGIAWYGSMTNGGYIKRTTDAGASWTDVPLPTDITGHNLELPGVWFAPDGQHGWLAGFDYTASRALLLASTDGGATWQSVGDVAAAVEAAGGSKLFSVFALDAKNVWVGGERGLVLHN